MKLSALLIPLALAACGKKEETPGAGSPKSIDEAPTGSPSKAAAASPFAEFGDNDAILKKWQGAWVIETGALGHYEAWEVKGNQVTSFDGKAEKTRELSILAPCEGKVMEKSAGGGSSGSSITFVFDGDKLYTGMGDAGLKQGDKYLACGSGQIFVYDGKSCLAHQEMFGRWEKPEATECKLDGGKLTTKRTGMGDMKSTFLVEGNVLYSEQMKGNKVEKATSFADAKAKLEARKK
jgi:hypothetical protein